ncbi:MAG: FlgD immunoglobulin-like domain containing protein [bacterium]
MTERNRLLFGSTFLSLALALSTMLMANEPGEREAEHASLININNLAMWVHADGRTAKNPYVVSAIDSTPLPWGTIYPRGLPVGVTYIDGVVWGGWVDDGQAPEIRVGGSTFSSGLQPGAIVTRGVADSPSDPAASRVWRFRPDWQTADLLDEAFDLLAARPGADSLDYEFTREQLTKVADSLRAAYEYDLSHWPWQRGAPFYDDNGNSVMDPGELPGLLAADQVVWMVANDLDSALTKSFYGSPPIGLEVQLTLWGYRGRRVLDNVIFKRYRMLYKGTNQTPDSANISEMYISQWADPDLGSWRDDAVGCDTTLDLGYCYNALRSDRFYRKHALQPPAFGYQLLQGPLVRSAGSTAQFGLRPRPGFRNLPMTTFSWFGAGSSAGDPGPRGEYRATLQWWNILRGFRPRPETPPEPWIDAITAQTTTFVFSGDPVEGTGWIDTFSGGRRLYFASGPFRLALGDTQEVIIAVVAGSSAGRLESVSLMKFHAKLARFFVSGNFDLDYFEKEETIDEPIPVFFELQQNFPNPFNGDTEIRYDLPGRLPVKLTIYNLLGQKLKTLVDELQEAGSYVTHWDGTTEKGEPVASGLYLYRVDLGRFSRAKKMLLIR